MFLKYLTKAKRKKPVLGEEGAGDNELCPTWSNEKKIKWLRKKLDSLDDVRTMSDNYCRAMSKIECMLEECERQKESPEVVKQDQVASLNYALKVVRRDLVAMGLSCFFYRESLPDLAHAFPSVESDKKNEEKIPIDLRKFDVFVVPSECKKLTGSIHDLLRNPFCQEQKFSTSYSAVYYPEVGLVEIGNGKHHSAVASLGNGGVIDCSVISLKPQFKKFKTNGGQWLLLTDDGQVKVFSAVYDFRLAMLYSIAQARYNIQFGLAEPPFSEYWRNEFWDEALFHDLRDQTKRIAKDIREIKR